MFQILVHSLPYVTETQSHGLIYVNVINVGSSVANPHATKMSPLSVPIPNLSQMSVLSMPCPHLIQLSVSSMHCSTISPSPHTGLVYGTSSMDWMVNKISAHYMFYLKLQIFFYIKALYKLYILI